MTSRTIPLTDSLYQYWLANSLREPALLSELRLETAKLSNSQMQIAPEQGQLMRFLVELLGIKKALELGVYTGYSALCVAYALPEEGRLVACDINPEWTEIAKKYWRQAGVQHKIHLHLSPALQVLEKLLINEANTFDFAFIDADKMNYDNYYEKCLQLLRPGGLIAIDNVFQRGNVVSVAEENKIARTIHALNVKIHQDERVSLCTLPIGDGLTLARKRG